MRISGGAQHRPGTPRTPTQQRLPIRFQTRRPVLMAVDSLGGNSCYSAESRLKTQGRVPNCWSEERCSVRTFMNYGVAELICKRYLTWIALEYAGRQDNLFCWTNTKWSIPLVLSIYIYFNVYCLIMLTIMCTNETHMNVNILWLLNSP